MKIQRCENGILHFIKIPSKWKPIVVQEVIAAYKRSSEVFAYDKEIEVVVFSSSKLHISILPELGIGAMYAIQGDIVIDIDFSRKNISDIVHKHLPSMVYHEFSHVVRRVFKDGYPTLLEGLVTEGIGGYVETKMSDCEIPYTQPIEDEEKFWQQAKAILDKKDYNHFDWFFGAGKMPRWIGYRLGFLIVDSFMRNKKLSLDKLVRADRKTILEGSGMK